MISNLLWWLHDGQSNIICDAPSWIRSITSIATHICDGYINHFNGVNCRSFVMGKGSRLEEKASLECSGKAFFDPTIHSSTTICSWFHFFLPFDFWSRKPICTALKCSWLSSNNCDLTVIWRYNKLRINIYSNIINASKYPTLMNILQIVPSLKMGDDPTIPD